MSVCHDGGLATDGFGDAAVAVTKAGDSGAARGVDDPAAVGGVQVDALATDGDRRDGAGTVKDAGHLMGGSG